MTGFILFDAAIGVLFALLVFSLIASALQEAIASVLNWRGKMLRRGIQGLMSDKDLGTAVLDHGLIRGLHGPLRSRDGGSSTANRRLPSSIPAAAFAKSFIETILDEYDKLERREGSAEKALALVREKINGIAVDDRLKARLKAFVEVAKQGTEALDDVSSALGRVKDRIAALGLDDTASTEVIAAIGRIENGADSLRESVPVAMQALKDALATTNLDDALKEALNGIVDHVEQGIEAALAELVQTVAELRAEVEACFNQAMDRVVGWYVRRTKYVLFTIGFLTAAAVNFNLLGYAKDLIADEALRAKIVAQAQLASDTGEIGGRKIAQLPANTSTVWAKADAGAAPDQKIGPEELTALLENPGLGPLGRLALNKGEADPVTLEEAQAAYDQAWARVARFDADGNMKIEGEEAQAAADEAIADLQDEIARSATTLNRALGDQGVPLGWPCSAAENLRGCLWSSFSLAGLLSWLAIGLGCTMGGQFWYDMLKNFLKVRTAAAGVKTDSEKTPAVAKGVSSGRAAPA